MLQCEATWDSHFAFVTPLEKINATNLVKKFKIF